MREGWLGLNTLTDGAAVLPDEAVDIFGFSCGQASFDAAVEGAPAERGRGRTASTACRWRETSAGKISQLFFNP